MRDFRTIKAWHKAHTLAMEIYRATRGYPTDERFALISQTQRAAISIPANIAEGCGHDSERELARYCQIASGSASELEYLLLAARDLEYISEGTHQTLDTSVNEVKRMLNAFVKTLKADG